MQDPQIRLVPDVPSSPSEARRRREYYADWRDRLRFLEEAERE